MAYYECSSQNITASYIKSNYIYTTQINGSQITLNANKETLVEVPIPSDLNVIGISSFNLYCSHPGGFMIGMTGYLGDLVTIVGSSIYVRIYNTSSTSRYGYPRITCVCLK